MSEEIWESDEDYWLGVSFKAKEKVGVRLRVRVKIQVRVRVRAGEIWIFGLRVKRTIIVKL